MNEQNRRVFLVFFVNTIFGVESIKLSYLPQSKFIYIDACNTSFATDSEIHLNNGNYTSENSVSYENAIKIEMRDKNCKIPHIPRAFFEKLTNLESISLEKVQLESIEADDFGKNENLQALSLRRNLIRKLPANLCLLTPQMKSIYLSRNNISQIDPNAFGNGAENLKCLELAHNQIESLDVNVFANATTLDYIDLSNNRLKSFEPNLFQLKRLEYLLLYENLIEHLNCNIYPESSTSEVVISAGDNRVEKVSLDCNEVNPNGLTITELKLHGNLLEKLTFTSSNLVKTLRKVYADGNKISSVSVSEDLDKLTSLNLGDNRLMDDAVVDIFKHCVSLETFSLSRNNITKLDNNSLLKMEKLKYLFLGQNNIHVIPLGLFSNAKNLKFLDISGNNLTEYHFDAFPARLESLEELYLNDNKIKYLNGWNDSMLPGLRRLGISNNSLECGYLNEFMTKTSNNIAWKAERSDYLLRNNKANVNGVTCHN